MKNWIIKKYSESAKETISKQVGEVKDSGWQSSSVIMDNHPCVIVEQNIKLS
jgi:hypothetical protein